MSRHILGLCVMLALIYSCSEQKEQQAKSPTRVATKQVSAGATSQGQTYVGIVEEREATAVSFTGMGVVKHLYVSEGQAVSRGQLIADMDDTQARNLLTSAEAQMAQANDALKRYKMLHDNGSLPEVQWVEIQSKVVQAQSQLEIARKNLADCRLTAPVSGIIGKTAVKAGETALPSQAVVSILDISTVKVKVSVPETELGSIGAGTPSWIHVDAIGRDVAGGRIEKGVQADAMTHTYDVWIHVHNSGRQLLPGMVASVRFATGGSASTESRWVPVTSVQKRADGTLFVWLVDEKSHTAHRATVKVGSTRGNDIAIVDGLETGQRIVVEGYQKLSEDTQVTY